MSDATFETFLVSGLLVLIAAIAYMAWAAWRWVDRERDMEKRALTGVSYELRHNLKRMMSELADLASGTLKSDIEIIPVVHPQLDALLARPNEADRGGLTVIRSNYNELSAHKQSLRAALANQADVNLPATVAADAVIGSLATLYLWEEHKGCAPEAARSTRSWAVRDWMKANKFHADSLPGLHLRDQVVERLRRDGMTLTPKPLTYTASEYFAKQYDRKADPNAPFWKRKKKKQPVEDVAVATAAIAADTMVEPAPDTTNPPKTDIEPAAHVAPEIVDTEDAIPAPDTQAAEIQAPEIEASDVEAPVEAAPDTSNSPETDNETAAHVAPEVVETEDAIPAPDIQTAEIQEPQIAVEPDSLPDSQAVDPESTEPDLDPVESQVESAPESKPSTPGAIH